MSRFAAKLLFQFRVVVDGGSGKRRICEERILNLQAKTAQSALRHAQRRGKAAEYSYKNSDDNNVYFEFVGVLDLLELGVESESDEVWYDIYDRVQPMERRKQLIPTDAELLKRASRHAG